MTASQPFTTTLISSNMKMFKYCWVWDKISSTGHVHAKNKPMKRHEDVCVFSPGTTVHEGQSPTRMTYNPQGLVTCERFHKKVYPSDVGMGIRPSHRDSVQTKTGYPNSILQFSKGGRSERLHPTQKPVALMEYLIKTYTNEGETVLDFTMGSGTTGVACVNLNRNFIGIELDGYYYEIAKYRVDQAVQ